VDVAKMKAEFLYHYQSARGIPRRAKWIAGVTAWHRTASRFSGVSNRIVSNGLTSRLLKKILGIHPQRSLPEIYPTTLRAWFADHRPDAAAGRAGTVYFFCDEFTNLVDVPVGIAAIELLERLGYQVILTEHAESGRAAISQGLLEQAKQCAEDNVGIFGPLLDDARPLIGVEPSALLTFRDEYPALVDKVRRKQAQQVARCALLIDEFVSRLITESKITSSLFTTNPLNIRLHGHCHQRALSSLRDTLRMLQLPRNFHAKLIPAGCCGMAGAFGYEQEHYEISMKIGELVLFPAIRLESSDTVIAATGTSCRHQIRDGTRRTALHPVQILRDALR
jgi:Fe-S oxidoreductase